MRIDGAPAMGDVARFLTELTDALERPRRRFEVRPVCRQVLGNDASAEKKESLRAALRAMQGNVPLRQTESLDVAEGFGRLDAFGRIFNTALTLVEPTNGVKANAPLRFPELKCTNRTCAMDGVSPNRKPVRFAQRRPARGVFATIDPGHPPPSRGYALSCVCRICASSRTG